VPHDGNRFCDLPEKGTQGDQCLNNILAYVDTDNGRTQPQTAVDGLAFTLRTYRNSRGRIHVVLVVLVINQREEPLVEWTEAQTEVNGLTSLSWLINLLLEHICPDP
jgi:hypothetical protein